ncbi:MAG: NUDIX hydrolase [Minisyncoccia bacterium]
MNVKNFKIFHEISAGGVVISKERKIVKILVIHRNQMDDWTLPKGHQKQGESLQKTAIREVKEETSVLALPQKYLGKFTYRIVDKKRRIICFRTVHWFLMTCQDKKLKKQQDKEILQVVWRPLNKKTLQFLTYQNDKNILKKAKKILMTRDLDFN